MSHVIGGGNEQVSFCPAESAVQVLLTLSGQCMDIPLNREHLPKEDSPWAIFIERVVPH